MNINYIAILVTVVANFVLGFIWYTPLFGKRWALENNFDTTRKSTSAELGKGMTFMVIGNIFMAYVFAHNIAAWSYVPGTNEAGPVANIIRASVFTWLGFFVPVDLSTVAWEKKSWTLFFINTGYHLATLLLAATILTYMS